MMESTSMSPGSIMPNYPWLFDNDLDISSTPGKIEAMQTLGVPYPTNYASVANADLQKQAESIALDLEKDKIKIKSNKEIIALIAYMQRLGTDIKLNKVSSK